jgi:hypothetical protein
MSRTSWLLGTLLLGTVSACGGSGNNGGGSGEDAAAPVEAGVDATSPVDASGQDVTVPPVNDSGGDATSTTGTVDGGSPFVAPGTLDFGLVNCGSTAATQTFTVTNPGTFSVTWTATLGMGAASNFQLSSSGGTLKSGQSTQVTVTPNAVGSTAPTSLNALGDIVTVSIDSSTAAVALTETAQGAVLSFEPTSVPFGPVPLASGPQSLFFAVQNSGNLAANVTLTLTGDSSFSLPGGTTTQTLTATAANIVDSEVTFSPTTTNSVTGGVALALDGSTALCGPLPSALPVSGNGTNGQVGVSPDQIVFGTGGLVPCGTAAAPVTVTLQNTGTAPFTWTGVLTHGGSYYSISPASGTVAAGLTETVTVTPKAIGTTSATTAGEYDDTLTITTNSVGDSPHVISLEETAQGAIITRPNGSLGFGSVGLGATITNSTSIVFANTGNVAATVTFTNGAPQFVQASPLTLGPGTFAPEVVSFTPSALTAYTDIGVVTLDAEADGGAVPLCGTLPVNLSLTGTGSNPTFTASPGSLNFGATTYTAELIKGAASYFAVAEASDGGAVDTSGSAGGPPALAAGGIAQLLVIPQILPEPTAPGNETTLNFSDTLQVVTASGYIADVTLSQTALSAYLTFKTPLGTSAMTFGTASGSTGQTVSQPLTVTNGGTSPATVTLTALLNGNASESVYTVTPSGPITIPAGASAAYTVVFSPPASLPDGGALTLPDGGLQILPDGGEQAQPDGGPEGTPYPGAIALSVTNTITSCASPQIPANITLSGLGD